MNVILGVVFLKHQMLIIELGFKKNGICFTLHMYQMEMLGARVHFSIGSFEVVPGEPLMLALVPLCALITRRSAVISRHVSLVL